MPLKNLFSRPQLSWILRAVFYCLFIVILDRLIQFDTPSVLLSAAAVVGTYLGARLATSRLRPLGFALATASIYLITFCGLWLIGRVYFLPFRGSLEPFVMAEHGRLLLLSFTIALISTWLFFRIKLTATIESVLLVLILVQLLANHRNFRFDLPKVVNSLAWQLSVTPLTALIIFGALFSFGTLGYLYVASLPSAAKSSSAKQKAIQEAYGQGRWLGSSIALCVLSAVILLTGSLVHRHYGQVAGSRLSNGVGEEGRQGMSPLGFHSALGGTNQPAAVMRLDSDYQANPFSPMLYLRESALSSFNGHEMVIAPRDFDKDTATEQVGERVEADEIPGLDERQSVTQSIFLLAEAKNIFAIDYPISVTPLKAPDKKFVGAYKAVSLAPRYALNALTGVPTGETTWSETFRAHYLTPHSDPRYGEIARDVTRGISDPVAQAFAVTRYLSKTSIYTLSPNHEVAADADQTAPFLFGDHRGYCVHFAHATVYMFRALGIPSRIGTGYLTDLSQAKDGHSLLRMSDRHAWAEVYLQGKGWIPFDTQPEQVESHAETEVDKKLLEDLMGMLGPNEEILPKTSPSLDAEIPASSWSLSLPEGKTLLLIVAALFITFGLIKAWLRYGYMCGVNEKQRLSLAYISHASRLQDLGITRGFGETRSDFAKRLQEKQVSFSLTDPLLKKNYSNNQDVNAKVAELKKADGKTIRNIPFGRRIWGMLNPSSVISFLTRRGW